MGLAEVQLEDCPFVAQLRLEVLQQHQLLRALRMVFLLWALRQNGLGRTEKDQRMIHLLKGSSRRVRRPSLSFVGTVSVCHHLHHRHSSLANISCMLYHILIYCFRLCNQCIY